MINVLHEFSNQGNWFVSATGEPPLCMSIAIVIAIRRALESARIDAGRPDDYFLIGKQMIIDMSFCSVINQLNRKFYI